MAWSKEEIKRRMKRSKARKKREAEMRQTWSGRAALATFPADKMVRMWGTEQFIPSFCERIPPIATWLRRRRRKIKQTI